MQLFICPDFQIAGSHLTIKNNPELVSQLRKVLRAKPGYNFYIQKENPDIRYHVSLQSRTDQNIETEILEEMSAPQQKKKNGMLIALPNKQEKLELIVQKLTEIGIQNIFLWSSERSVLKTINENKRGRLDKIMKEAVEQSWGWNLPKLQVISSMDALYDEREFVVFDLPNENYKQQHIDGTLPLLGVIGPEGGLTETDYQSFPKNCKIYSLGDSVLRMETAAIIGAWNLKNLF